MNTLIFLFGVWFNPAQVVTLSVDVNILGDNGCQVHMSRGKHQDGPSTIISEFDCKSTAELINVFAK